MNAKPDNTLKIETRKIQAFNKQNKNNQQPKKYCTLRNLLPEHSSKYTGNLFPATKVYFDKLKNIAGNFSKTHNSESNSERKENNNGRQNFFSLS